jgi:chaperonin GroEL
MKKNFSLFNNIDKNINTINQINDCVKISLGPTGKNGIIADKKNNIQFLTTGSLLIKSLEFKNHAANVLVKLFEQASIKTYNVSSDGSTTTIILACELLRSAIYFLINGYNAIFISNGLRKIAFFLVEKVSELSQPVTTQEELKGILRTSLGKKISSDLLDLMYNSIEKISRDGLTLVEENISPSNEIEIVQGVELDKGYASSYFVNDLKNFEVVYENPYLLVTNIPITNINQIREIIEYIKTNNRPLIIVAEEINKEIISTLVLNNIQKKFKVAVVKYTSIKFVKNGVLDDLSLLTHTNYFVPSSKGEMKELTVNDLGQAEKVILTKDKSTFIISKFSKLIAKRRINELNRELLSCETEYEKNIYKTRIARLSGNITKIKLGVSDKYQIEELRQKIENAVNTIKSSLEEGVVPGGGIIYLTLAEELRNWAYLNLIGEEIFALQIVSEGLKRPFDELFNNTNTPKYKIFQELSKLGYPYGYDLINKKFINTFKSGLLDSTKSVRSILWNSLTIIATLISSE